MIYDTWDVITVPFPFTDKNITKKRPALIISKSEYYLKTGNLILTMITTAKNSSWYIDFKIKDLSTTGLTTPSKVRFKIFTIDGRLIFKKIGYLSEFDKDNVKKGLLNTIDSD